MENKRTILNSLLLLAAIVFFVLAAIFLLALDGNNNDLMITLAVISEGIGFGLLLGWIIKSISYLYKEIEKLKKRS